MKTTNQTNVEAVAAFIEDASNQSSLDGTEQFFIKQFWEAFTGRHYTADEILAQGDTVIAKIFMTAVHSAHFAGNAPSGRTVRATQFREFCVIDGNITGHRGWFDTVTLLPQIQKETI